MVASPLLIDRIKQLRQEAEVNLQICDGQGRLVRKLELGWKDAGYYTTAAEAIYWGKRYYRQANNRC